MQPPHNTPAILAAMRGQRESGADQQQTEGDKKTIYVYQVEGGNGLYLTDTPIPEEDQTFPQAPVVDVTNTPTQPLVTVQPPPPRVLFSALRAIALVLFLLLLDSAAPLLTNIFTPTAVVTLIPQVYTLSLRSTAQLGKLLDPITLTESQTTKATGHGHQDAARATGTITFYNGLFTPQFIGAGTVYTGNDGIQVVTDQSVTVPANIPPADGQATISAHAVYPGAAGNIVAGDVTITINNGLLITNTQFSGGQDSRDFSVVKAEDIQGVASNLKGKVASSMAAALQGQLITGEQMQPQPCHPQTIADHGVGEEATSVTVTVSLTCTAIVYNSNDLQTYAMQMLTTQAHKTYGQEYTLSGSGNITVTKASTNTKTVVLSFTAKGIYIYQLTTRIQQELTHLIVGKPRLKALAYLRQLPGIKQVSISGVQNDQELPDSQHIHLLIVFPGS